MNGGAMEVGKTDRGMWNVMCVYICHNILCTYECAELCCLDFLSIFLYVFLCVRQVYICAFVCLEAKLLSATNKSRLSKKRKLSFVHSCWSFFRQLPKIATTCFFLPTCFSVTKKQQLLPKTTNSRVLTWITDTHGTHRDNFSFFKGLLCFFFSIKLDVPTVCVGAGRWAWWWFN